jgi:hypothetical protein
MMRSPMLKSFLTLTWIALCLIGSSPAEAAKNPLLGTWKVATTLVSAYDPTNPAYQPGQRREETWKFARAGTGAQLTTWAGWKHKQLIGSIDGTRAGKAWVFDAWYDTGWGILIHQYIVARVNNNGRLTGTIETGYHSAQFGYILGKDALSFYGFKGKK